MAKITLADVPTGKIFEDTSSTVQVHGYADTFPIRWYVVGHDSDGTGITTLIAQTKYSAGLYLRFPYDAKEPINPDTTIQNKGNTDYATSNLLQYLNSDGLADEWYSPQHQYDQAPITNYVDEEYTDIDAFLAHFSQDMKDAMVEVTKMGVSRKVHIPSVYELVSPDSRIEDVGNNTLNYDQGTNYNTIVLERNASFNILVRGENQYQLQTAYQYGGRLQIHHISPSSAIYYPYKEWIEASDGSDYASVRVIPMIFLKSDSLVEYNSTDQIYYAAWDNAPVITLNKVDAWKNSAFDITFKVTDADQDTVATSVKIDNTEIYSNPVTTLNTNITVSVTSTIFNGLSYGEHEITITADDSYKETVKKAIFRKVNSIPNVLYTVSENKVFVDENTLYNGEPIEWYVAAKDIDGDGIVSLIMKTPISGHEYDAKEIYNPITTFAQYGNNNYEKSNILQWLNTDGGANNWYVQQHAYDAAPSYAKENGFLHDFGFTLEKAMETVTKFGQSRKVHIPSEPELFGNTSIGGDKYSYLQDSDVLYPLFNGNYKGYITRQYPASGPDILVRGGGDYYSDYNTDKGNPWYEIPSVMYSTANSAYSWKTDGYRRVYSTPSANGTAIMPLYIAPVIYLSGNNIPIRYDSTADKYYLDFNVETQYQDYGKHNKGFTVEVKINCNTAIGDTTVKIYFDNSSTEAFTTTISTFNQFVDIKIPDNAVKNLSVGSHTMRLETDTFGISGRTSITYTKTVDTLPTILSSNIGNVIETFSTTYQVYDDDGDSLDVVIKLDGTQIDSIQNVTQHTDLPLTLTTAQFNALGYGNHSIVIEATDGTNTSTETLPFVKNSVPSISLSTHDLGEVLQPVTIDVTFSSDDGDNVTIKAYIDNQEIS